MISGEFSFDLDEKSVENLKKAINYDEIEERYKRFMNGTETIDDLINGILHYRIKNDDGLDLDVVEFKYYQKMIDLYLKEKEKNKELESDIQQQKFEINCLNSDIKNMYHQEAVISILENEFDLSRDEAIQILEEE